MNVLCVLFQIGMLRRKFRSTMLLQIPYAVFFGILVNFFYYNVLTFELHAYPLRFIICILSILGISPALGILTALNLVALPVETTCNIASGTFHIDYAVLRVGIDVICIVASLVLSFAFDLTFTIREGTFIALFLLGPLEKKFMRFLSSSQLLSREPSRPDRAES
jgi:uncharacterized membrane protein YczE